MRFRRISFPGLGALIHLRHLPVLLSWPQFRHQAHRRHAHRGAVENGRSRSRRVCAAKLEPARRRLRRSDPARRSARPSDVLDPRSSSSPGGAAEQIRRPPIADGAATTTAATQYRASRRAHRRREFGLRPGIGRAAQDRHARRCWPRLRADLAPTSGSASSGSSRWAR